MFAPDYSATFVATKLWTNSTWSFYVLLNFYGFQPERFVYNGQVLSKDTY